MNLFTKTAKETDTFFYQIGDVKTNKIWTRPSYYKLKYFLERIKKDTNILENYEAHIIGGVLFSFENTWDVDICITGHIYSFEKLEDDLHLMYEIALNEFQLLIDVQWLNELLPNISFKDLNSPEFKKPQLQFIKLNPITKKINDDIINSDILKKDGIKKISNFLVQGYHEKFPNKKKFIDKIFQYSDKLIKSSLSVSLILENDELFFLNNTNRF